MITSNRALVAVFGCGGLGREIMPEVERLIYNSRDQLQHEIFYVVDDKYFTHSIDGRQVIRWTDFQKSRNEKFFTIAVSNPKIRRNMHERCVAIGATPLNVKSPHALISDDLKIADAATFGPFSHVSVNTVIGSSFHLNYYACVAHDCVIGNFVTFGPRAQCNGHVVIEDDVYIGAGALIREGSKSHPVVIGQGAVIGMGAVILKSVSAFQTVVGNPAHLITRY